MKIALYARVSTEKQERQQTIQSQIAALEDYAKEHGHTVAELYVDDGWSGSVLARPALDRLRDDASRRLFEGVAIHSPDRLARTYVYQELLIEELKKAGVQILFLNRPLADTPEDKMLQGMQGLFAEYEKAKIAERCRRGKLHKARSGRIVGHMAPYGYRYVRHPETQQGAYFVDREEAEVVKLMFRTLVDEQLSLGSLVRLLHERKIRPRKGGQRWERSSLSRILRNQTYTGVTHYNKGYSVEPESSAPSTKYRRVQKSSRRFRPKAEWIPIPVSTIIPQGLFERAQQQLTRNAQLSPRRTKYRYLLRGLTRCGQCGSLYAGIPCHGKRQYRCRNKERRFPLPKNCRARMISAHILEPLVWSSVKEAIQNPGLILRQFERVRERVQKQAEMSEAETQRIDAAQAGLAAEENRLLEAYRAGVITLERLRAQMSQVDSRRKGLARERSALLSAPIMVQNAKAWLRHYSGFIRNRMRSLAYDERQKFLRSFVSEITIFDDSVHIKGYVPTEEPPRAETVLLCPNGMYGMDANKHLPFVLVRELKHGKARPKRADNKE